MLFFVQARAITQQARSPVIRVYATSPDQAVSDSTAGSDLGSVTSEAHSNGTSNGTGHSSPQSTTEDTRCAINAWQLLSGPQRLLYKQHCRSHAKEWRAVDEIMLCGTLSSSGWATCMPWSPLAMQFMGICRYAQELSALQGRDGCAYAATAPGSGGSPNASPCQGAERRRGRSLLVRRWPHLW